MTSVPGGHQGHRAAAPPADTPAAARDLLALPDGELFRSADGLRAAHRGDDVDLCSILNVRSGACSEDCAYCAQSARYRTGAEVHGMIGEERLLTAVRSAREHGARRFCTVTSGRRVAGAETGVVAGLIAATRREGLLPCATLGLMEPKDLRRLQDAGLVRYHHNLETSEAFFPRICTTHTFREKLRTLEAAAEIGLSLCCGGIFGLGETWDDRIAMAFAIRDLPVDSVPLNFLTPIPGTPLGERPPLEPREALRIVALYRHILPDREIRICGGRPAALGERWPEALTAGADGLLIGNYLTTTGPDPAADVRTLRTMVRPPKPA